MTVGHKELPFLLEEYQTRLAKVRQNMGERGLDACLINAPENIHYLTGLHSLGFFEYQTLVVPADGKVVMVTRNLERPNVWAQTWLEDVVAYADGENPIALVARVLAEAGLDTARLGVEKDCLFFSISKFEALQKALPRANFENCSGLVERFRMIKSETELAYIRQAARIAEKAMAAAIGAVREGATENDVAAVAYATAIRAGGEYSSFPPFVTSGPRVPMLHATWAGRKIAPGEPVLLEVAGCVQRYHAILFRCALYGEPSQELKEMEEVCVEALLNTIEAMKPGAIAGEVDRACRGTIRKHGYGEYFDHRSAYSVGATFPPSWSEGHIISIAEGGTEVLQPGMVFHIVPTIMIPGRTGVVMDEMVVITQGGCEKLTNLEYKLFVNPH